MATIEGLFNFDEKLLARQVAGQRDDYHMGQLDPGHWGLMAAGVNKISRGLFNNPNDILKEKAIAEEAMFNTMEIMKGDTSDQESMLETLQQQLGELGASADTMTKLETHRANLANEKAETEANIAYKQDVADTKKANAQQALDLKKELKAQKERGQLQIGIKNPASPLNRLIQNGMKNITGGGDTDDKAYAQAESLFYSKIEEHISNGESAMTAIAKAEQEIKATTTYTEDTLGWGDSSSLTSKTPQQQIESQTQAPLQKGTQSIIDHYIK